MPSDVNVLPITDDVEITQNKATMCDQIIYNDAEAQCDSILKRSVAVQTLAKRKPRKQKHKRTKQSLKKNCQTPIRVKSKELTVKPTKLSGREVKEQPNIEQDRQDDDDIDGLEVSDDGDNDYADDLSFEEDENDVDYVYSESGESSDEDGQTPVNERKFIVFESMLDQLFISCKECGSLCEIQKTHTGSMVTIRTVCCNNHTFEWRSQPEFNKRPAGNILIPSAVVFTGSTYETTKQLFHALNMNFVNKDQFYKVQDKVIFPTINKTYNTQQKDVIKEIKKQNHMIDLYWDGRSDSPGHNAKYGTYSLMDESSEKVVDFSLVHVGEVSSSNAMENEGCQRSLNNVLSKKIKIRSLTTDRHTQITSELRKKYPAIIHQYDVWHLSRWVTKNLSKKAKKKGNEDLTKWIQSVSNHLWWSAQTCNGDPELLQEKWISILHHVVNKHKWKKASKFHKCGHGKLSRSKARKTKWLKTGSPAHIAMEEVVMNTKLLKGISKLTEFHHTGSLEVYHSLLLKYAPKRLHFSYKGMIARTQLAVIDHNSNVKRQHALVKKGKNKGAKRYNVVFPKGKKKWVAKPIMEEKSYSFVQELMKEVLVCRNNGKKTKSTKPATIPKNIASFPLPSKDEIITKHKSRMAKKVT